MSKTPTAKEIAGTFRDKCGDYPFHKFPCHICRYDWHELGGWGGCLAQYTKDILEGKMTLSDGLSQKGG